MDPANTDAVVAALLHDVIEDTGIDAAELKDRGIPQPAIDAIEQLTRRDDQPSATYYQRIHAHPTAREVKLADLADNTDPDRLAMLSEVDRARPTPKYGGALRSPRRRLR
ncbi:HD domain-containing protein [Mycobacterium simiae]|uniref:HD domain-containing protein n=1 Tax=Mycobacterium simiae TaxID=1784 RepID=UPI000417A922|nr:HD domain-containing protein [Mycobacterium simiae]BBX43030.1 hypothetical protein MSIM_44810 [Mycobacterium simiae]